jgi:hydrogenase small subunit
MAQRDGDALNELLASRGVTRRDFLKFCGSIAAMVGLSESMAPKIASAIESAAASDLVPAVWLNGGACTGCTESTAQSDNPNIAQIVLEILSVNYIETIMMSQGEDADKALMETVSANDGQFIMVYEGSVMKGFDGNALRVSGRPSLEILEEVAPKAAAIVAVGSCAVDGGWVRAFPNPADATGVSMYLEEKGIATPVVNLPTCPVNPEWVVAVVVDVLLLGSLASGKILEKLDGFGRPKYIYGQTIHDNCPRRGHFENGEFVYEFGSEEEAKGFCLYALGCKGPQTFTNCPIVRWNSRVSWCVESGSPCIGCGGFNWADQNAPFLNRFRNIWRGAGNQDGGFAPSTFAGVTAAVVAGGLVIHGVGSAMTGRTGGGPPTEAVKEHDAKRQAKGGGQ